MLYLQAGSIKLKKIHHKVFFSIFFILSMCSCENRMEKSLAECEAYGVSRDTCYKAERDDARSYQEQSHIRYDRALKAAEEVRLRRKAK